ncbi:hypothetical protein G7Z17_g8304 [Cylindrodendrum hubeiense]|uniref:Uncharacterized protein n=1 Tax=Cylindrodendrum hubeiense TaxID=595255 RepID=A0A9P5L6M5_9HYPO|nr:hypothetical protein G7Z17_g8304 [Cylindrodendrum hubeiense]
MLSAKHHILFWTISILSIPIALFRHRLHAYLPPVLTESVLEHVVHGLIVYMIWKKKKGLGWLYFVSVGVLCVASEEAATEMGFVGKMPTGDGLDEDGIRILVAHGLTSFVVLGTLEPIMRDRRDIEVYGMVTSLVELTLYVAIGQRVDLPGFWFPEGLTLMQTFVHVWLLSPLLDVVETASYIMYRMAWPESFQRRASAIHNQP